MMSEGLLLRAIGLTKRFPIRTSAFGRSQLVAVDEVDLDVNAGEIVGLVGESGCGKSTVGRLLLRLLDPTEGRIEFTGRDIGAVRGRELRNLRRDMQMVFQDPSDSLNPRMTVGQAIMEPLALSTDIGPAERRSRVRELLAQVGLRTQHFHRYPHQLSGGQQQRVGIARAIVTQPRFVVLDEPTSALDVSIRGQILQLLLGVQQELGLAYLLISHDISVVRHVCGRVAVMYLGKVVESAPTPLIFGEPIHPYTQALLSAVPIPDPFLQRERIRLDGEIPSPLNLPPGCRLYSRCPQRVDDCAESHPPLVEVSPGHRVACYGADR